MCECLLCGVAHLAVMSSHCTAQACKSRCLLDVDAWSHLERAAALETWVADTTARGVCVCVRVCVCVCVCVRVRVRVCGNEFVTALTVYLPYMDSIHLLSILL